MVSDGPWVFSNQKFLGLSTYINQPLEVELATPVIFTKQRNHVVTI